MLQAPPDGSTIGYNPSRVSLAAIAYLAANLTGNSSYMWLAGRADEFSRINHLPVWAQPGIEEPLAIEGKSPQVGSCLLYSHSGTPTQVGPLAPDKIVLREGWNSGDSYLLLNLRFTGWHRYKATNSIIALNQGGPIIVEQSSAKSANWLPIGRSQFRDKRIPRENLNGLILKKKGMSLLIFYLTGFGSLWAQNPPFFAEVENFQTGEDIDISQTVLPDWNGWKHTRTIMLSHSGPVVVYDQARADSPQSAAITWHALVPGNAVQQEGNHFAVGERGQTKMHLIALSEGTISQRAETIGDWDGIEVRFKDDNTKELKLITVFLSEDWRRAEIDLLKTTGGPFLRISLVEQELRFRLP